MTTRHVRIFFIMVIGMALLGEAVSAQMPESPKGDPPRFENFRVNKIFHGKPAQVDLSSHPYARTFRTRLRDAAKKGPNFAGHYALAAWRCGNECQMSLAIDLRTGKVYGPTDLSGESVRVGSMKEIVQSSRLIDFRLNSKLFIADPPCPEDYNPCVSSALIAEPVRYYIMEKNGLRLIHKTPCWVIDGQPYRQQCGD
jgi:hypothetical protein